LVRRCSALPELLELRLDAPVFDLSENLEYNTE